MDQLAAVCERVASHDSRLKKIAIVANYLRHLSDDDLVRAVRFLCCAPVTGLEGDVNLFGEQLARKLSVGYVVLRQAAVSATGWDEDLYRLCHREVGDTGETISLLLRGGEPRTPMSLARAEELYRELYRSRRTADKVAILKNCFLQYPPLLIKYFVKVITGDLRIGLQRKQMEEAVAAASELPLDDVRDANNRLGDLSAVALAARRNELHAVEARLFHPMQFMLAKPLDNASMLADPENYVVEDKFDGIRSQVHLAHGRLVIYSRGMEEVTSAFPELEQALQAVDGSCVLDGEILAWRDDRAVPFTLLQQRLARKQGVRSAAVQVPVVFMAYDILYRDGSVLVDEPLEKRRAVLEQALTGSSHPLLMSDQYVAGSAAELDHILEDARIRGNEGLLLKKRGSRYESGRRSGAWLKLKRPYATLDVVVTAAEQGQGRRATMLSDYTFAVRSGDQFVNVGKAYSGLTDIEVRELTRLLRSIGTDRFGRVVLVRPEVILEVAFDGIQKSPRHKSGFALRFPRIVRWRRDKKAKEADDIDRVRALYESSLNLTAPHD